MKVVYSDLKNKRVFISGGGSGIGATIVEHFCEQKSEVYFIDIDLKSSNKLIKNIKPETFAFAFSTSLAPASAVPPVAIKSSIIKTLSFFFKEDLCISKISKPYSNLNF